MLLVLPILALLLGCGPPAPVQERFSLLAGDQVPLVLTEQVEVELPPSFAANRFVRGWWPYTRRDVLHLSLLEGARLQAVGLADARRRLVLEGHRSGEPGFLEVRVAGGDWQRSPLKRRMNIPLPSDLPLGRFSIDFRLSEGADYGVRSASFSKAAPAGTVETVDEDVLQSGFSILEIVRRVRGASTLEGSFRPPRTLGAEQRFSIRIGVSDEQDDEEVFAWSPTSSARELSFSIPIESDTGFARIRLVAEGGGGPGRWQGLTLVTGAASKPTQRISPPDLPKVVVLYIMDALRSDHLGHLGGPEGISPTIDRLAADGATFEEHFSIAPNTVPSMKTLLTGKIFLDTGGDKLPPEMPTMAGRFREAGYRTGLFSGNGNVAAWRGMTSGFDYVARRVLFAYRGRAKRHRRQRDYNDNAELVHEAALQWVDSLAPDDRVFLHLQTIHPHNPYDPPEPFLSRFAGGIDSTIDGSTKTLKGIAQEGRELSAADQDRIRALYAAGVAYNDHHLGPFIDRLLERYPREEILLILTSDHGEELFDHRGLLHGYTLYDEQLRIPLVVWWPGSVSPQRIDRATTNLDLHASIAELLDPEGPAEGGGSSLWPMLLGDREEGEQSSGNDIVFAAASSIPGGIFMARSAATKVILAPRRGTHWGMGGGRGRSRDPEYIFDFERDSAETQNFAGEVRLEADWLRSKLLAWIETGRRLEEGVPLDELDDETRETLRALGYLQ